MSSRFWWFVRRWWHLPQMMAMSCKPEHPRAIIIYYKYLSGMRRFDGIKFLFGHGRRMLFRWIWWHRWTLLNLQPFRCKGDKGGWQTDLCEWLEMKARSAEDREDLVHLSTRR